MPTETLLVVIPVVLLFVFFAGTLMWADVYSNRK